MKKKILIILSDPHSANYEIVKKSIFFFHKKNKNQYLFIGCQKDFLKKTGLKKNNLDFINIKREKNTKKYLLKCFQKSFELLKEKKAHGLINLPLNKKFLPQKYPGFTEYISKNFKLSGSETMLMFADKFSVSTNTTHILLKDVSAKLNKKKIKINTININNFYKNIIGIKKPKLAILGVNPHNGIDFKSASLEESRMIKPVIKYLKKKNITLIGPLSADSAFNKLRSKKINCYIGNYHDQVLPIFKYINQFNGINITLGLPFLRVSPDHGTAKDITNKNLINNESFLYAVNFFEKYSKKI